MRNVCKRGTLILSCDFKWKLCSKFSFILLLLSSQETAKVFTRPTYISVVYTFRVRSLAGARYRQKNRLELLHPNKNYLSESIWILISLVYSQNERRLLGPRDPLRDSLPWVCIWKRLHESSSLLTNKRKRLKEEWTNKKLQKKREKKRRDFYGIAEGNTSDAGTNAVGENAGEASVCAFERNDSVGVRKGAGQIMRGLERVSIRNPSWLNLIAGGPSRTYYLHFLRTENRNLMKYFCRF